MSASPLFQFTLSDDEFFILGELYLPALVKTKAPILTGERYE